MNFLDHIGAGNYEIVVATIELFAAEVFRRQVKALDASSHRAVIYQHLFLESVEITQIHFAVDCCRCVGHAVTPCSLSIHCRKTGGKHKTPSNRRGTQIEL